MRPMAGRVHFTVLPKHGSNFRQRVSDRERGEAGNGVVQALLDQRINGYISCVNCNPRRNQHFCLFLVCTPEDRLDRGRQIPRERSRASVPVRLGRSNPCPYRAAYTQATRQVSIVLMQGQTLSSFRCRLSDSVSCSSLPQVCAARSSSNARVAMLSADQSTLF
jgi:hypothetical protein